MKIQLKRRRANLPALAILAIVIFVGLIIIVLVFPEVGQWVQESLRIVFGGQAQ